MTRDEHREAAKQLQAILDRKAQVQLTREDEDLIRRLRRHHERQGATYGTCMDCGLAVTLPDPDRAGPECTACGGVTVSINST